MLCHLNSGVGGWGVVVGVGVGGGGGGEGVKTRPLPASLIHRNIAERNCNILLSQILQEKIGRETEIRKIKDGKR